MAKLRDTVREYLTPTFIAEAAHLLGEEENNTAKALYGLCATILAGLLDKADDPEAMQRIFHQFDHYSPHILEDPGVLLRLGNLAHHDPKEIAGHWMGQLFGHHIKTITHGVASFSGIKLSSASFLIGVAGPIVMAVIGHRIQSSVLNASGLANLLLSDRERILTAMPSGLGVALGFHAPAANTAQPPGVATGMQWLLPLLLLLALGGGIMVYLRYCGG